MKPFAKERRRIMGYAYGKIEPPVSVWDVRQVLSELSNDVGTLCQSQKINKWARYKPQRVNTPAVITQNTRKSGFFGLNIPFCTNDIMNGIVHSIYYDEVSIARQTAWEYLRPRGDRTAQGGIKEYYRLSDFVRIPNDTTDDYYNTTYAKGYNHNARIPFEVSMALQGATEKYSSEEGGFWYYEINAQVTNTLTFTFFNSVGDDIHLQDLVNIGGSYASGVAWRPVLQVFRGSGSGSNAWYNRGSININNGDIEVGGAAITTNKEDLCTVSLNLNAAPFYVNGSYVNYFFHICVGVGCCKQDFSAWNDNNNSLFLIPFDINEYEEEGILPCYYIIKIVSAQVNKLEVTQIQWHNSATAKWTSVTGNPTFEIGVNADQQIRLTMTYTNKTQQKLDFVAQNGSAQSGYTAMKVQAIETITGTSGETTIYMQPTNSSWTNGHTTIESSDATKTLYATINTSVIPAGSYATYHLKAITGGATYDNIGSFAIYKRRTV